MREKKYTAKNLHFHLGKWVILVSRCSTVSSSGSCFLLRFACLIIIRDCLFIVIWIFCFIRHSYSCRQSKIQILSHSRNDSFSIYLFFFVQEEKSDPQTGFQHQIFDYLMILKNERKSLTRFKWRSLWTFRSKQIEAEWKIMSNWKSIK